MPRFDKISKREHRELSRRGGQQKNPNKGFGSMDKKRLAEVSNWGAQSRWKNNNKEGGTNERNGENPSSD